MLFIRDYYAEPVDRREIHGSIPLNKLSGFPMRHVISAVVQNVPGVLAHVSGMLASRGYNIDSLAVGETEDPRLSRMTFVVVGGDDVLDQVRKQLDKIVTVVSVQDISSKNFVERDLMLIKVQAEAGGPRSEILELVSIFRGQIVDVSPSDVIVEISGRETKIQAFIERMRPYGILELVRTGRIAMVRGSVSDSNEDSQQAPAHKAS
jgi:acetolactate synthase I/III small subunit